MVVNNPLIRPYLSGWGVALGVPLDSHDKRLSRTKPSLFTGTGCGVDPT